MDDGSPDAVRTRLAQAEERIVELQAVNETLAEQNADLVFRETELRALLEKNGRITRREWQEIATLGALDKALAREAPAKRRPMKSVTPVAKGKPRPPP